MVIEIDTLANAASACISAQPVDRTKRLDTNRFVDYNRMGEIEGIEFLNISKGVDLDDLPHRDEPSRLFAEREIRELVWAYWVWADRRRTASVWPSASLDPDCLPPMRVGQSVGDSRSLRGWAGALPDDQPQALG